MAAAAPTPPSREELTARLGGRVPLRIYMLDNSFKTLLVDEGTTAGEICGVMATKLSFSDAENDGSYFALFCAEDGAVVGRSLQDSESPLQVQAGWPESGKLVYQVKLFMDSLKHSFDPAIIHMLYLQGVHDVITGAYPCAESTAVQLAALQIQAKFGPHKPQSHQVGFLGNRLVEYVPQRLMPQRTQQQWEADIFRQHALVGTGDNPEAEYLDIAGRWDAYGCAFFLTKQRQFKKFPTDVMLAVNPKGIHIMNKDTRDLLQLFKLSEIFRWGFRPKVNFYFEVKKAGGSGPMHEFATEHGKRISELLTDYAMAFLKKMGISSKKDAPKKAAPGGQPSAVLAGRAQPTFGSEHAEAACAVQARFRGYRLRRDLENEYAAIRVQVSPAASCPCLRPRSRPPCRTPAALPFSRALASSAPAPPTCPRRCTAATSSDANSTS